MSTAQAQASIKFHFLIAAALQCNAVAEFGNIH